MTRPSVLIAAKFAPTGYGGLAQYQRLLARELRDEAGAATRFCAMCDGPSSPPFPEGAAICLDPAQRAPTSLWMRLATRRIFHPVLEISIRRAFATNLRHATSSRPTSFHFVGTGWDFLGFAMNARARQLGASFTIWPAVHPGQWGDDAIDVRLYNKADTVFCQSQFEAKHLILRGVTRSKLVVCGLPPMCEPDGDGVEFRTARRIVGPSVLFVGRRVAEKGFQSLVRAWPLVMTRFPTAVLCIAGEDGPNASELLATIPADNLCDLGTPDQKTIADAFGACDIFCMPSSDESFGIAYAEAWSYAKPVICGPAPAPREWIQDGSTGLHAAQDPTDLAAAIMSLLADPARASEMGKAGLAFQRSQLTPKAMLAKHLASFRLTPLDE